MTETVFNSLTTTDHRVHISQVFIYYMTFVCLQYYFLERKNIGPVSVTQIDRHSPWLLYVQSPWLLFVHSPWLLYVQYVYLFGECLEMCNRIGSSCHEVVKLKSLAAKLKAEGTHCYLFVFGYIKVFYRERTHMLK